MVFVGCGGDGGIVVLVSSEEVGDLGIWGHGSNWC